ncbi:hypothetical protein [Pseudoxanthomonas mexicana]|uniref:hypothetical protein n=1 Tax=Pseudoxanthomonas mexicana TaxID=128785 RepID=UPI00398B335F
MSGKTRWLALASCAAVAACATRVHNVDQRLILPEGAARYEMADSQAFVFPMPQDNAAPSFPEDYAPRDLPPTTICVAFVVDAQGAVDDAKALSEEGCAPPERYAPLRDAALAAVSQWRYQPAMFCDYPDAATRDRDWNGRGCAGDDVRARVVAVSLAYAFTFEVRDGERRVRTAKAKTAQ